ncbi:MAG: hypothetical protein ACI8UO_000862 [Verrucomicrobiales bacterium]|jgi:hypothetical protein
MTCRSTTDGWAHILDRRASRASIALGSFAQCHSDRRESYKARGRLGRAGFPNVSGVASGRIQRKFSGHHGFRSRFLQNRPKCKSLLFPFSRASLSLKALDGDLGVGLDLLFDRNYRVSVSIYYCVPEGALKLIIKQVIGEQSEARRQKVLLYASTQPSSLLDIAQFDPCTPDSSPDL